MLPRRCGQGGPRERSTVTKTWVWSNVRSQPLFHLLADEIGAHLGEQPVFGEIPDLYRDRHGAGEARSLNSFRFS